MFAHFTATTAAGAFVFFSLIAVQGLLLTLVSRSMAARLAVVLQAVFVAVLLQMIVFLPRMGALVRTDLRASVSDSFLGVVPSIWFLELYDLLGGQDGGSAGLAVTAVVATLVAALGAAGLLVVNHAGLMRTALEGRELLGPMGRVMASPARHISNLPWRHPVERAACEFTLRTLVRSRTHGMLMALCIGTALALVVSGLIPIVLRQGLAGLARPDVAVLSAPLVLAFAALVGMRVVASVPVEPRANWIIRLLEPAERAAVSNGVRNALLAGGALPATVLAETSAGLLWGARPALVHAVTCALMTWLLAEVLLVGLGKLPFTSTYYPGRARLRTRWPLYFMGFTNYCFTTASFEPLMMESATAFSAFVGTAAVGITVARTLRLRRARALPGLTFEEEDPEALFQGFRLSEGLAAGGQAVPQGDRPPKGTGTLRSLSPVRGSCVL